MNKKQLLTYAPLALTLVSLVFLAFAGGAVYAIKHKQQAQLNALADVMNSPQNTPDDISEPTKNPEDQTVGELEPEAEAVISNKGGVLNIDWLSYEKQEEVWLDARLRNALTEIELTDSVPKGFRLGWVKGGAYDGYGLNMYIFPRTGLGTGYSIFYILDPQNKEEQFVFLDQYSGSFGYGLTQPFPDNVSVASSLRGFVHMNREWQPEAYAFNLLKDVAVFDQTATVPAFDKADADIITDQYGRKYSTYGVSSRYDYPSKIAVSNYQVVGNTSRGEMHMVADGTQDALSSSLGGAFFTIQEDGRIRVYELVLPFWSVSLDPYSAAPMYQNVEVTWNDGSKNQNEYFRGQIGGCGFVNQTNIVSAEEIGSLTPVGTVSGLTVYGPTNVSLEHYALLTDAFKYHRELMEATDEVVYQKFIEEHAVFFYKDNFGQWIQFTGADATPLVECGKPVIYLYPEETTDIDVALYPQGGFSVTEPTYNNGWRVTAQPDGSLTNRDDGEVYPYLFWEGRGGLYTAPEHYWIVERERVETFLIETLAKLGLNTQETADFMEFWLPRMQAAPFYKIGFHGTEVMNAIAPMTLSQEPQTMIRILMDYEELDASVPANPPALPKTPERNGFTVIEWGGVLK